MAARATGGTSRWLAALLLAGCVMVTAVTAAGFAFVINDYWHRSAILAHGHRAIASITDQHYGKDRYGSLVCTTHYAFRVAGKSYRGERRGCNAGSPGQNGFEIAYDPAKPANAVALSEGPWRGGEWSGAALLGLLLIIQLAGWASAAIHVLRGRGA